MAGSALTPQPRLIDSVVLGRSSHLRGSEIARIFTGRVLWGTIALLALPLHAAASRAVYAWYDGCLAWILLCTFLYSTRSFLIQRAAQVPLLPFATFQIYLQYGFAQFSQDEVRLLDGSYVPSAESITTAMMIVALGTLCLVGAFHATRAWATHAGLSIGALFPSVKRDWSIPVLVYGALCLAVRLIFDLRADFFPASLRNVVLAILNPNLALLLVLYFSEALRSGYHRGLGIVMLITMVIGGLASSMLESVFAPVYIYIVAAWMWRGRLRLGLMAVAVLAFVVLSPIKHHYRYLVRNEGAVDDLADVRLRLGFWKEAAGRAWDDPWAAETTVRTAADRTSAILSFAQVIDWVPASVPHHNGASWATTAVYWIPRVVWPEKPDISDLVNNRFALEFRYSTTEGLRRTTVGIVEPANGYWDFGTTGALLYVSLLGVVLGLLAGRNGSADPTSAIITAMFSANMLQILANFPSIVASTFAMFTGAWIAMTTLRLVSERSRLAMMAKPDRSNRMSPART